MTADTFRDASPKRRRPSRHLTLLCLLLLLFVISPFIAGLRYGVVVLNIIGAVTLLAGVHTVGRHKVLFRVTVAIAAIAVVINGVLAVALSEGWTLISYVCLLVLLALFSIGILGEVLRAGKITADKIYGAICVYLLVGYAWTFAYAIVDQVQPGSFAGAVESGGPSEYVARVMRMRYFSFVTLTTVGFGDITPRSPTARTFAMLEAVMGQIYHAVLVARLVGLHIVHSDNSKARDE